jgi:regulatory protein
MDDPDTRTSAPRTGGRRQRRGRARAARDPGVESSVGSGSGAPEAAPVAPESRARTIALRQLTAGPRTRNQLAETLTAKGIPAEAVDAVLDRFRDVGLVDDQAFARSWVESRHAGRGLGRQVLRHELRGKGVDEAFIDEAVGAVSDTDEMAAARALVRRKLPSMSALDNQTRTRRLLGQLARRGYGSGIAFAAIRAELTGAEPDDSAVDRS